VDTELTVTQSVLGALVIALALVLLHLAAPRIRKLPLVPETATGSFAGGLAVSYVFLHLLPEIAEGNEAIGKALTAVVEPTPLVDLAIFLVALAGFTAFYGLERLARRATSADTGRLAAATPADTSTEPAPIAGTSRATAPTSPTRPSTVRAPGARALTGQPDEPPASAPVAREPAGVYWLHLSSFMVYNALITYTMPLRLRTGIGFAVLFTVAMGLHFVLTDRGLEKHYPRRFGLSGRLVLAGALLLGWAAAALVAPTSALLVALLTALLGGSILLNVFKEELPSGTRSSFPWFLTGLTVYAVLLAITTALSE
jgi:hypothetical protein